MRAARMLGPILAAGPAGVTHGYPITEIEPEPKLVNNPSPHRWLPASRTSDKALSVLTDRATLGCAPNSSTTVPLVPTCTTWRATRVLCAQVDPHADEAVFGLHVHDSLVGVSGALECGSRRGQQHRGQSRNPGDRWHRPDISEPGRQDVLMEIATALIGFLGVVIGASTAVIAARIQGRAAMRAAVSQGHRTAWDAYLAEVDRFEDIPNSDGSLTADHVHSAHDRVIAAYRSVELTAPVKIAPVARELQNAVYELWSARFDILPLDRAYQALADASRSSEAAEQALNAVDALYEQQMNMAEGTEAPDAAAARAALETFGGLDRWQVESLLMDAARHRRGVAAMRRAAHKVGQVRRRFVDAARAWHNSY